MYLVLVIRVKIHFPFGCKCVFVCKWVRNCMNFWFYMCLCFCIACEAINIQFHYAVVLIFEWKNYIKLHFMCIDVYHVFTYNAHILTQKRLFLYQLYTNDYLTVVLVLIHFQFRCKCAFVCKSVRNCMNFWFNICLCFFIACEGINIQFHSAVTLVFVCKFTLNAPVLHVHRSLLSLFTYNTRIFTQKR